MMSVMRNAMGGLVVLAAALLGGCGGGEQEPGELGTDPGAESPNEAVRKLVVGMSEGRGDVVASAVDQQVEGGEAFADFLRRMAELSGEVRQLEQQVREKFGEEGVAVLEEQLQFEAEAGAADVEQMEIEIEGDQATARLPDEAGPMDEPIRMVRREDRWYIQPPEGMTDAQAAVTQAVTEALQQQVEAVQVAIEQSRTLEELQESLETAASAGFPFDSPVDVPTEVGPLGE